MINRLLGIIYIVMKQGTVTASELAQRFEVSIRTIYRDLDTLSAAGIPIYAKKGKNGGISLTEQFVLDKMLITEEEQQEILSALVSLRETGVQEEQNTLQKLGEFFKTDPVDWIAIDLSDWSGTRKQLYDDIKKAILSHKLISFEYYGQSREMTKRIVEPMQLFFKEYTWYLRAFCRERQAPRMFKLFRMKRVEILEESFIPRNDWNQEKEEKQPEKKLPDEHITPVDIWIDKKEAYKVYDRFEEDELEVLEDGNFVAHLQVYVDDWIYGLILSFGPSAKVIAPDEVRLEMQRRVKAMMERYEI